MHEEDKYKQKGVYVNLYVINVTKYIQEEWEKFQGKRQGTYPLHRLQ